MTFWEWFYKAVIIQVIMVAIILFSVVVIKFFFKEDYQLIIQFYKENIIEKTSVSEVLEDEI